MHFLRLQAFHSSLYATGKVVIAIGLRYQAVDAYVSVPG
jgi:hypothetical protein